MIFVVVIMFVIMWLPLQTFSFIVLLFPDIRNNYKYKSLNYNIFVGTYFVCHWLSVAHSCLNPLIYCFMNDNFRTDLEALVCWRQLTSGKTINNNNSSSSRGNIGGFKSVIICDETGPMMIASAPPIVTSSNIAASNTTNFEPLNAASANQSIKVNVEVKLNFDQSGKFPNCPHADSRNSTTTVTTIFPARCGEMQRFINGKLDCTLGHSI